MRVSTSQPFAAIVSQSAKPAMHAASQRPATQLTLVLAPTAQRMPQAPQCSVVVAVLVSHPFVGIPSQSAKGAVHMATAHAPFMQRAVALGTSHRWSQRPQWADDDCGSTQAPPQQVWPVGHGRSALHPAAQRLPTQSVPGAQSAPVRHSTHARVVGSQRRGPVPASPALRRQASSSRHPATQRWVAVSQRCPSGHASRIAVHATQRPVAVSHTAPAGLPTHAMSCVHPAGASVVSAGLRSPEASSTVASKLSTSGEVIEPLEPSLHAATHNIEHPKRDQREVSHDARERTPDR
jgi:hypothetical protein